MWWRGLGFTEGERACEEWWRVYVVGRREVHKVHKESEVHVAHRRVRGAWWRGL